MSLNSSDDELDDKKRIYIYEIFCKDPNINENYIGQTECFEQRKYNHSRSSKDSDLKLYKTIRKYGGWDNWDMKILNYYYCKNQYESRQIEQKYIEIFKATLNSVRAYSKSHIDEELDRQLEFQIQDFSNSILGCYLYDYLDLDIDETEIECDFCNKSFSNISNLRYHKKTNKKCQVIQNKDNKDEIESSFVNCEFCNKLFTVQILKTHYKNCKKKSDFEINELRKLLISKDEENNKLHLRITELETQNKIYLQDRELVQKLAMQPKNTTTNNDNRINNNFFDDPERIKRMINEKLNEDYVCDGQKGVAQFAYDTLLKDEDGNKNYICSDPSRHIFKFKNSDGNIEKDVKAIKLTNMLIDAGISSKSYAVAQTLWTKENGDMDPNKFEQYGPSQLEITELNMDNSIFRNKLAVLTSL
jgi:hypothetical protein